MPVGSNEDIVIGELLTLPNGNLSTVGSIYTNWNIELEICKTYRQTLNDITMLQKNYRKRHIRVRVNNNNNRLLLRQYSRRSSSVARQNQGNKQTRDRKTLRESSMDG